jgi:hypothetical protein
MKKRENVQYCTKEAMAEMALCQFLSIPFQADQAGLTHLHVGHESIGVVVVAGHDSIELDLEHMYELSVDIIVFAVVHDEKRAVNLLGCLSRTSIRETWAKGSRPRTAMAIAFDCLDPLETLKRRAGPRS